MGVWDSLPGVGQIFLIVGGICAALACTVGGYLIVQHLRFYTRPTHQRYIVRILLMVPIYAIYSVLAIAFFKYQVYFALLRDTYEAYVIYQFFSLCVNYGGGNDDLEQRLKAHPPMKLTEPLCCVEVQPGRALLRTCRRGVLQYVLVRPITGVLAAVLYSTQRYEDGNLGPNTGYLWLTIINNVSVTISLYFLVVFYQMAHEELKPYHPLLKFLCIKFVVFFSFWQGVLIAILSKAGVITSPDPSKWTNAELAVGIQNFLICIEMLVVSVMHIWAFPYDLYRVRFMSQAPLIHQVEMGSWLKSVTDSASQRDVISDSVDAFVPGKLKKKLATPAGARPSSPSGSRSAVADGGLLRNAQPEPTSDGPLPPDQHQDLSERLQDDDASLRTGRR